MIKQCLSYSIIYYFHQMRFASASSTRKKYVNSFNIISITFYILFRPFMNIIEDFFCFEFKEFIPSAISLSGSICGINVGIVKVLFISVSSETFSLGYSAPGVSSFSIWPCGSWLLIKISLSRECVSSAKSPYGSNLILLMFIISWTPRSCNVFWYNGGRPHNNTFSALNGYNKSSTWWANLFRDTILFGTWYRSIILTLRQHIFSPEIIILICFG